MLRIGSDRSHDERNGATAARAEVAGSVSAGLDTHELQGSHSAAAESRPARRRGRRRARVAGESYGRAWDHGPWGMVQRELDRARRYGRTFALVALPAAVEADRDVLAAQVRSVDLVWRDGDAAYVLLPEAETLDAAALVARLWRVLPELAAGSRVAVFPTSGMTLRGLREALDACRIV